MTPSVWREMKSTTQASNRWLAEQLHMGRPEAVSVYVARWRSREQAQGNSPGYPQMFRPDRMKGVPAAEISDLAPVPAKTIMETVSDLPTPTHANDGQSRHEAVLFWEKLRVLFVVLLALPAWAVYSLRTRVSDGVGDTRYLGGEQVALLFLVAFVVLNLCYSSVYALEFFFRSSTSWKRYGRWLTFFVGTGIGVVFALLAARDIGGAAYTPTWISSTPR